VYMQQRYYDPIAGRFLSVDPVVTDVTTGGFFGRYHYANNNPFRFTDPTGMSPDCGNVGASSCKSTGSLSEGGGRAGATAVATPPSQAAGAPAPGAAGSTEGLEKLGQIFKRIVEGHGCGQTINCLTFTPGRGAAKGGLAANPFKGKSFAEIDKMLTEKGFKKVGPDAASGKGAYFHPESGRKYYLDKGGVYREGTELPHVDVHRMRDGVNLEGSKRRYPLGENLIEPKP
jgi:hypothetical protein